ncbi:hypothetical protein [Bizionia arctica]|uniref:Uncharacterized protein n=1 Tax=Bizionia arctica TaxID=1495645 RepID=A0A917GTC9_9FLAO|nr:hypothetical protein [Bizionia arctica]GGG56276.1 hypothetical protein GCM10010976_28910 [Bizionia arctica]
MKLFLKYLGEYLRSYPQVKFSKNDAIQIRDSAMGHLGFTNINQLRDRYEGQSFFDKTMKNIGGLMAVQKYLNKELIDVDKANLTDFHPYIKLNDTKIDVHVFDFGTLPSLKVDDINDTVFFIIQKDNLTFLLCGFASVEVIKQNLIETCIVRSSTDYYMDFTGFKFLKHIDMLK